jgi:hypothetical protein
MIILKIYIALYFNNWEVNYLLKNYIMFFKFIFVKFYIFQISYYLNGANCLKCDSNCLTCKFLNIIINNYKYIKFKVIQLVLIVYHVVLSKIYLYYIN